MPNSICVTVTLGFQSSPRMERHTEPLGKMLGWKKPAGNLPVVESSQEVANRNEVSTKKGKGKGGADGEREKRTEWCLGGVVFRELDRQRKHAVFPRSLAPETSTCDTNRSQESETHIEHRTRTHRKRREEHTHAFLAGNATSPIHDVHTAICIVDWLSMETLVEKRVKRSRNVSNGGRRILARGTAIQTHDTAHIRT